MTEATSLPPLALLRLLQLSSPTLPIGAYAYSQGLEYAVEVGWVKDEATAQDWFQGILEDGHRYLDVPILARLYRAWGSGDEAEIHRWNNTLFASRESAELQAEERHLGTAAARLLQDQGLAEAGDWLTAERCCLATLYSMAAVRWQIPLAATALGYCWSWTENQVAAAIKTIPLGQSAGQRLLAVLMPVLETTVSTGLALPEDDIGASLPGIALASAHHEVQYSRLFRS